MQVKKESIANSPETTSIPPTGEHHNPEFWNNHCFAFYYSFISFKYLLKQYHFILPIFKFTLITLYMFVYLCVLLLRNIKLEL